MGTEENAISKTHRGLEAHSLSQSYGNYSRVREERSNCPMGVSEKVCDVTIWW